MKVNQPKKCGAPFQNLKDAATTTGLSVHYLRKGRREGTVPHIMCGSEYRVNIPALFEQLGVPYELIRV